MSRKPFAGPLISFFSFENASARFDTLKQLHMLCQCSGRTTRGIYVSTINKPKIISLPENGLLIHVISNRETGELDKTY